MIFLAVAEAVAEGRKTLLKVINHSFGNEAGGALGIWDMGANKIGDS